MAEATDPDSLTRELAVSGLFDAIWYLQRNDDVTAAGKDPLAHFVDYGWAEGRSPNRYFDPVWYRLNNADVAAAGVDPLLHYIRDGEREGRRPHPRFDPGWYRSAYDIPAERLALGHYLANRTSGQFVPCADLFAVPLLAPYRDDPANRIDPVAHYLDHHETPPDLDVIRSSRLLDENYYLINAADVHEANADPSEHYCRDGWREYRKPNIYFDPGWYERTNPDLSRLKVNPLVHYSLVGERANRRPVPFFDPAWYRTEYAIPDDQLALGHYLVNRRKQTYSPTPLFDVEWYMARFGDDLGPNRDPFAHYLQAGMTADIDPSPEFDSARYRREHLGHLSREFLGAQPDRHNPLVHYLRSNYTAPDKGT